MWLITLTMLQKIMYNLCAGNDGQMEEVTYNDWLWEKQMPIEDLTEEEKEEIMKQIKELVAINDSS